MAGGSSSILVFVLVIAALFALLYISESTQSISPNKPRIVHVVNSNLSSSCLSVEHYESLFSTKGPIFGLPSYVPQGYALQCINVSGPNPSDEDAVSLYYFKDDKEFQSRFLPKIEKETNGRAIYAKWISEFYDAGGILVYRGIEYFGQDDPRYNDKLKHAEYERTMNFDGGSEHPLMKFADGNPVLISEFGQDQSGKDVNWLFLYMDNNWFIRIIGTSDSDELFKMAETIHETSKTETHVN